MGWNKYGQKMKYDSLAICYDLDLSNRAKEKPYIKFT